MILGRVKIDAAAISTQRDSYLLSSLSVVSVRRPFLGGSLMLGGCFLGFGAVFFDLLYPAEVATITGLSLLAILAGIQIGQLKLLSRDLRGSELSDVVWGQYGALNNVRTEIVRALGQFRDGDAR